MRLDLPLLDVDTQLLLRLQKELLFGLDSVGEAKIPIHKKSRRSFDEEERGSPTRIAKVYSSRKSRIRIRSTFGDSG
jgi:hypothetical protein